jgi:hypothetical protein
MAPPTITKSRSRLALMAALAACLAGCHKPAQKPRPGVDLSYLPAEVVFVAYADTVRLKESALYRDWDTRLSGGGERLTEAKTFLRRLGIDPEKDVDGLMLAYRPGPDTGEWVALLRGRFDLPRMKRGLDDASSRMAAEPHGRWTIYSLALVPEVGDLSVCLVDESAVALGKGEALERILDAREHPAGSLAGKGNLKALIPSLQPSAQIWALLDGRYLSRLTEAAGQLSGGMTTSALGSLSTIVSATLSVTLDADLSARLDLGSDTEAHARSLSDGLRGILGFAQLGSVAKKKDWQGLVDAIRVDGDGKRVFVRLDLRGDLVKKLQAGMGEQGAAPPAGSTR